MKCMDCREKEALEDSNYCEDCEASHSAIYKSGSGGGGSGRLDMIKFFVRERDPKIDA
jgi:hypothetical protein